MSPSEPDLLPSRPWEDLIASSRSRGSALRRRRRAALGAPPLVAAALLLGLPLLPSGAPARDRVVTDVAEDTAPATPPPAPQVEEPLPTPAVPGEGGVGAVEAPAAAPAPVGPGAAQPQVQGTRPSPQAAGPARGAAPADRTVAFGDAQDDARATGDNQAVQTFSRRDLDILDMTFVAGERGIAVEMVLLGDSSTTGAYYALISDPASGCTLRVLMHVREGDSFTVTCPGAGTSSRKRLAPTEDGRGLMRAVVPYDAFPSSVSPDRSLALGGETWDDGPTPPPPPPGASPPPGEQAEGPDVVVYDRASTDKRLSRRSR